MAAAIEKLAWFWILVSVTVVVDSQVVRPYVSNRHRTGFGTWPRFLSSSGLQLGRGRIVRPLSRSRQHLSSFPRQQPRLRTTVLQQTLVVNDNTDVRPNSRRNQHPSSTRHRMRTTRPPRNRLSPGGRGLRSHTFARARPLKHLMPRHGSGRQPLSLARQAPGHPVQGHSAGKLRAGNSNHRGNSNPGAGMHGTAGLRHGSGSGSGNNLGHSVGNLGLGSISHLALNRGHGHLGHANPRSHNTQQSLAGSSGHLNIGAGNSGHLNIGAGSSGHLNTGAGSSGHLNTVAGSSGHLNTGAGFGAGLLGGLIAGMGTGLGGRSRGLTGAGTGIFTSAGAGANPGSGAGLLHGLNGLGNGFGADLIELNNALNLLLGENSQQTLPSVSQSSSINPQPNGMNQQTNNISSHLLRHLISENRPENGDANERLRASNPRAFPDA